MRDGIGINISTWAGLTLTGAQGGEGREEAEEREKAVSLSVRRCLSLR